MGVGQIQFLTFLLQKCCCLFDLSNSIIVLLIIYAQDKPVYHELKESIQYIEFGMWHTRKC